MSAAGLVAVGPGAGADVSLSLGGRWKTASEERERQAQVIAHLSNQLEGLQRAYARDVEQVQASHELVMRMQAEVDAAVAERDQWKSAYASVADQRRERDQLVEQLMTQLRTLEETTRTEEVRAEEEARRAKLLAHEKALLSDKLAKASKELEELYARLAATNEALQSESDARSGLQCTVESMETWRASKESQVATLVKEKQRLFRLVTELRASIKDTRTVGARLEHEIAVASAANAKSAQAEQQPQAQSQASSRQPSAPSSARKRPSTAAPSSTSSTLSQSRSRRQSVTALPGTPFHIGAALSNTQDRPAFNTLARPQPQASRQQRLDAQAFAGAINNRKLLSHSRRGSTVSTARSHSSVRNGRASGQSSAATSPRRVRGALDTSAFPSAAASASRAAQSSDVALSPRPSHAGSDDFHSTAPNSARRLPAGMSPAQMPRRRMLAGSVSSEDEEEGDEKDGAADGAAGSQRGRPASARSNSSRSGSVQANARAKDTLLARLQRQVSLLEEKCREQDRSLHLLRLDNSALLVRFRAASERRLTAEKRTKTLEAECVVLRGRKGAKQINGDARNGTQQRAQQQHQPEHALFYEEQHSLQHGHSAYSFASAPEVDAAIEDAEAHEEILLGGGGPGEAEEAFELSYERKTPSVPHSEQRQRARASGQAQ